MFLAVYTVSRVYTYVLVAAEFEFVKERYSAEVVNHSGVSDRSSKRGLLRRLSVDLF